MAPSSGAPSQCSRALPIQYADYAVWQRAVAAGRGARGAARLLAAPARRSATRWSCPPTGRARRSRATRGRDLAVDLPAPLTAALKDLGRREGATLFMTLLAAFQVLLVSLQRPDGHRGGHADCRARAPRAGGADRVLRQHAGAALGPVGQSLAFASCWRGCATRRWAPTPIRTCPSRSWWRSWPPRAT